MSRATRTPSRGNHGDAVGRSFLRPLSLLADMGTGTFNLPDGHCPDEHPMSDIACTMPGTGSTPPPWDARATDAVTKFLRTTRVGCMGTERVLRDEEEEEDREGRAPLRLYFPFSFSFLGAKSSRLHFLLSFFTCGWGAPTMTG